MINVESANCPLLGPLDVHLITELSLEEEKQNNLEEANDEIDPHVGVEPSCAKLVWPQVPEEHHAANDQPGKAEEQPDEEVDRRDQQDGGATGWDQVPQQWQDVQQQVGVPAHLQPRSEWEWDVSVLDLVLSTWMLIVAVVQVGDDERDERQQHVVCVHLSKIK